MFHLFHMDVASYVHMTTNALTRRGTLPVYYTTALSIYEAVEEESGSPHQQVDAALLIPTNEREQNFVEDVDSLFSRRFTAAVALYLADHSGTKYDLPTSTTGKKQEEPPFTTARFWNLLRNEKQKALSEMDLLRLLDTLDLQRAMAGYVGPVAKTHAGWITRARVMGDYTERIFGPAGVMGDYSKRSCRMDHQTPRADGGLLQAIMPDGSQDPA